MSGSAEGGQTAYPEDIPEDKAVQRPIPAMDRHDEDRPQPAEPWGRTQSTRSDIKAILPDLPPLTKSKPNVALLILYILIAIPVTLLLIALILVPALLCLGLAAMGLGFGFAGVVEAFTAFSVFADMLLVFGLALAIAAFGLLLFWCFVWFLVGAIPGLIRGACRLGGKLCYREVPV